MPTDQPWSPKDPDEVKDYELAWGTDADKKAFGDPVQTSTWIITASGLVPEVSPLQVDSDEVSSDGKVTTLWVRGGTAGETYKCLNRVVTLGGRHYDQTQKLKCKEL